MPVKHRPAGRSASITSFGAIAAVGKQTCTLGFGALPFEAQSAGNFWIDHQRSVNLKAIAVLQQSVTIDFLAPNAHLQAMSMKICQRFEPRNKGEACNSAANGTACNELQYMLNCLPG